MRMRVPAPVVSQAIGPKEVAEREAGTRSIFELGRSPKQAMRTSPDLVLDRGGHGGTGLEDAASGAVTIFHAPLRFASCLERKAEHGERLEQIGCEGLEGWQVRHMAALARAGRLEDAWQAHAYSRDGTLTVGERSVSLEYDDRLAGTLGHLVRPRARQLAARVLRRTF